MSKKILILTALVLVFSAHQVQAAVIHSTWVGGEEGRWGDASNWDPKIVPDNTGWRSFVVTIDSNNIGVGKIAVGLTDDRTINRLDCYGNVAMACRLQDWLELTLIDSNGLTNHGEMEIPDWNLGITGNVTNDTGARLNLHPRSLRIRGLVVNKTNATIVTLHPTWVEQNDIRNAGTIIIRTGPSILGVVGSFLNTGQVQLFGGACGSISLFDNDVDGVIVGFGILFSEEIMQNSGEICAYGGSLTVSSEGPLLNTGVLANHPLSSLHIKSPADVNSLGTIEVNAGGGIAFDCKLVNESGATIKLLGGTFAAQSITQSAGATFEGFGGITGDVVIIPNGIIKLTGPTNIIGDVEIGENGTLEISDGSTLITGYTTNNGVIHVVNGDVVFQGGYSGKGVVEKE